MLSIKKQGKRKNKGFTLVELLVVVAIIAVLLMLAVPKMTEATKGSKVRTFEANFRTLVGAVNMAYADTGMDTAKIKAHSGVVALVGDKGSSADGGTLHNKPAKATYVVGADGNITATLSKDAFGGTNDYIAKYNASTSKIEVTNPPDGLATLTTDK